MVLLGVLIISVAGLACACILAVAFGAPRSTCVWNRSVGDCPPSDPFERGGEDGVH